jgi:beta-lactamase class A
MSKFMKPRRRRVPMLLVLSSLMLLGALGLTIYELASFTLREDRLAAGISVAGVRVGGMTQDQAIAAVEEAYAAEVRLLYQGYPITLMPNSVGFRLSTSAMFAEARAASESGGGFWERFLEYLLGQAEVVISEVPLVADYQTTALRTELDNIAARYDQPGSRGGFDVQSLTTFGGGAGYEMDTDAAIEAIDMALRRPGDRIVNIPIIEGSLDGRPGMSTLRDLITAYLDSVGFLYDGQTSVASIYIQDLTTGEEINILGDVSFTAASTAKVGILLDYFRRTAAEPSQDEAFVLANSLLCSANSSSNFIMKGFNDNGDVFRGLQSVTDTVQALGAHNTFLIAPFIDGSEQELGSIPAPTTVPNPDKNTDPDPYNQTTAEDLGTLFGLIYDCAEYGSGLMAVYPNGEYTQQECRRMIELMSGLDLRRLIQGGIPTGVRVSQKNGWVGEVTGNAGIVYPPNGHAYIISVFIWEDTGATGFQDYLRLWPIIEDISRATWNYFVPEQPLLARRTDLPAAAQECIRTDTAGNRINVYLPPYGEVNLDDIDSWRNGQ